MDKKVRVNNVFIATKYRVKSSQNEISLSPQSMECGPVTNKITYYNYLPVPVVVVERNGFRHVVASNIASNDTQKGFIIRVEKTIRSNCIGDIKRQILKSNPENNDELLLIRETLLGSSHANVWNSLSLTIDTVYTLDDFKNNNQCMYCDKRDLVLSLRLIDDASAHPGDIDTVNGDELGIGKNSQISDGDFALRLEIVDNNDTIGNRFTYALGEVRKIKTKTDPIRKTGVYYYKLVKDFLQNSGYSLQTEYISIQDAETRFGLFKSMLEAKEAGDLKEVRKQENLELQHQIEVLRRNGDIEKANLEALKREREDTLSKIEHENILREKEWDYAKREYEHKNRILEQELEAKKSIHESNKDGRKDAMDFIKFLPQLIIAIGAIFVVVAKIKTTK